MIYALALATAWASANALVKLPHGADDGSDNYAFGEALPNLQNVLSGSDEAHKTVSTKIERIQRELATMHHADGIAVAQQKKEYEHQLELQKTDIEAAEKLNALTKTEIAEFRKTNEVLRKKASRFASSCQKLRMSLDHLQFNLTTAADFIEHTLNTSASLLNGSETQIMAELDMQDAILHQNFLRSTRIKSIGLLQIPTQPDMASTNLVSGLLESLADLHKQKDESMASLKAMFDRQLHAGSDQLNALRNEYKDLKATLDAEIELKGKLGIAVEHLAKTHDELLRRKNALGRYLRALENRKDQGGRPVPSSHPDFDNHKSSNRVMNNDEGLEADEPKY